MMRSCVYTFVLTSALAHLGCKSDDPTPADSASATASASASASASAPANPEASGANTSPLAGSWEASFEAKKGSIELPPKTKDKARAKDEGKIATGPGKLQLTIAKNGDVRGRGEGSLGAFSVSGRVEGTNLRASVHPDDPTADHAMTGVLVGIAKGEEIVGSLRVAGPDATLVREAAVSLRKR